MKEGNEGNGSVRKMLARLRSSRAEKNLTGYMMNRDNQNRIYFLYSLSNLFNKNTWSLMDVSA